MPTIQDYVPILRWKQAERDGLSKIAPNVRERITPLFEFILPAPKRDKNDFNVVLADSKAVLLSKLDKVVTDINKCCFQGSALIDVHLLDGEIRAHTLKRILDSSSNANPTLIPVTHIIPVLSTEADIETRKVAVDYARKSGNGICIRIDRFNIEDADLGQVIMDFVNGNGLSAASTDLLIDLGVVSGQDSADALAAKLAKLPYLNEWRTFIVSGGAFPKDLSELEKHSHAQLPRHEWGLWKALSTQPALPRKPVFSDYTIQHPIYYGHVDGIMNTSASIRYTDLDYWEVDRGEGVRNEKGAGYNQYPALAQILVSQNFYKGSDYSFGDNYISERAQMNNKSTGNATTWLKAGINHHLTLVAQERAKLP